MGSKWIGSKWTMVPSVITSKADIASDADVPLDCGLLSYGSLNMPVTFDPASNKKYDVMVDTGSSKTAVSRDFLALHVPHSVVHRNVEVVEFDQATGPGGFSTHWTKFPLWVEGTMPNGTPRFARMMVKADVVPNLTQGLIIGLDVLEQQGAILYIHKRQATFSACQNIRVPLVADIDQPGWLTDDPDPVEERPKRLCRKRKFSLGANTVDEDAAQKQKRQTTTHSDPADERTKRV